MFGRKETRGSVCPVSGRSCLLKVSAAVANCWRPTWRPGEEAGPEQLAGGQRVWRAFNLRGGTVREARSWRGEAARGRAPVFPLRLVNSSFIVEPKRPPPGTVPSPRLTALRIPGRPPPPHSLGRAQG